MEKPTSPISRRRFLHLTGAVAVAAIADACGITSPSTPAVSLPQSPTPPVDEEEARLGLERDVRAHVDDHFGPAGSSLLDARVTNEAYRDRLAIRADGFRFRNEALPLTIDAENVIDLGGIWTNDLMLMAPVAEESAASVVEALRREVPDEEFPAPVVLFSDRRFLDVGASRRHGSPLLGSTSRLLILPNVPVSADAAPSVPPASPSPTTFPVQSKVFWMTPTGVHIVAISDAESAATEDPVASRSERVTAFVDHLVLTSANGTAQYARFSESEPAVQPAPSPGYVEGEVAYVEITLESQVQVLDPGATSSHADAVVRAPRIASNQEEVGEPGHLAIQPQALAPGEPEVISAEESGQLYGPPGFLSLGPFAFCSGFPSRFECDTCVNLSLASYTGGLLAGLKLCLEICPGASISCVFAYPVCLVACWLGCTIAAAAVLSVVLYYYDAALRNCRVTYVPD